MGLGESLRRLWTPRAPTAIQTLGKPEEERSLDPVLGLNQWLSYFTYGGLQYPFTPSQTLQGNHEEPPSSFTGYVQGAYKSNGVIFACLLTRLMVFSEARFQWRRLVNGRPGELFGTAELRILETPWPGATTGDLLTRIIQDADLAGNAFVLRQNNTLRRLRPDWVTIVLGSRYGPDQDAQVVNGDLDAEVLGYAYQPGGPASGRDIVVLGADQVAHFAPIPDPIASYRGMSWLTPVIREVMADSAASTHKLKFFENGATANAVVSLDPSIQQEAFNRWIQVFQSQHEGVLNAYKTLYLGGGADYKVIGSDMHQMDFKVVQGAGETRIAAAAGVPPIIVGLSEGLAAGTYNNYGQARRRFADGTMWPLWRNLAGSMQRIVTPAPGAHLWIDARDVPFLREDAADVANIHHTDAQTMRTLIDAGFEPKTVVQSVISGDFTRLVHTGLYSVQLQPPGTEFSKPDVPATPKANGKAKAPAKNGAPTQSAAALLASYITPED